MSERAGQYYQEQAQLLGLNVPKILLGQPVSLLAENGPQVALHNVKSPVGLAVVEAYKACVAEAAGFVWAACAKDAENPTQARMTTVRSDTYRTMALGSLIPQGVRTGQVRALHLEAIAPEEMAEDELKSFSPAQRRKVEQMLGDTAAHAACLVSTAVLASGSRTAATRAITVVAAEAAANGGRDVVYLNASHRGNGAARSTLLGGSVRTARQVQRARMGAPLPNGHNGNA